MSTVANVISPTDGRTGQAAWLALANLVSFGMTLVMSAILSRNMPVAEYGTFRQVLYVYGTLLTLFSLGLPKAYSYFLARIPIAEGRHAVRKLNFIVTALASVFAVVLFFGSDLIADMMGNPPLGGSLRLFAIVPVMLMPVLGVESILTVYGMARKVVLYVTVSRTFSVICTVLPVSLLGMGLKGAVTGLVVSSILTCMVGIYLSSAPFRGVGADSRCCRLSVKEILRFAMPVFYSGIYGFIIGSASQFFVSRYFGVTDFAIFANGYHELPFASMVIGAVAGTMLPEFSRMSNEGKGSAEFLKIWKNVVVKSSMIIYPLSIFSVAFAPEIIAFLYGDGYSRSATLFRIVTIVNLTRIVPYGPLLFAVGKGRLFADSHLVTAILLVGLQLFCVNLFPSIEAIAIIASSCTVFCLALMLKGIANTLQVDMVGIMPWAHLSKIFALAAISVIPSKLAANLVGSESCLISLIAGLIVFAAILVPTSRLIGINYGSLTKSLSLSNQYRGNKILN